MLRHSLSTRLQVIGTIAAVASGLVALFVMAMGCVPVVAASQAALVIDPEVRALAGAGRTRVLVELRVPATSDPARRADAIARVQDEVLSRLPQAHTSVARRYSSVPLLALEIDGAALRVIETMPDVVAGVKPDRTERTQ
jgi:hypothetical protein